MKIAYSIYELKPVKGSSARSRKGALLQITFRDGSIGYSDCHPWPEVGDPDLDMQLELFTWGHPTSLMRRSLAAARMDADARKGKRNLFADMKIPASHHHMTDFITRHRQEFEKFLREPTTIKIKVGLDPQAECKIFKQRAKELINSGCRLRLDFNYRLNQEGFLSYLQELAEVRECVEFFEDPFRYQPHHWQRVRQEHGVALACDRDSLQGLLHPDSCDVLVVKPAVQDFHYFLHERRRNRSLVVTSYLDHPIGQLASAYIAAWLTQSKKHGVGLCGLLTHHAYELNPFSSSIMQEGNRLIPSTDGHGWGYDTLLKEQAWTPLM